MHLHKQTRYRDQSLEARVISTLKKPSDQREDLTPRTYLPAHQLRHLMAPWFPHEELQRSPVSVWRRRIEGVRVCEPVPETNASAGQVQARGDALSRFCSLVVGLGGSGCPEADQLDPLRGELVDEVLRYGEHTVRASADDDRIGFSIEQPLQILRGEAVTLPPHPRRVYLVPKHNQVARVVDLSYLNLSEAVVG